MKYALRFLSCYAPAAVQYTQMLTDVLLQVFIANALKAIAEWINDGAKKILRQRRALVTE
jgi:hypothetical protein